ncbi:MAG: InlB B-repeat-containing protein, partial [Clostridia bacterium]|nr:InlB B-repeat-containing protein [Clostridia bacterium]
DDAYATFTCGKNPNAGGGESEKKAVKFLDNDGDEISSAVYAAEEKVTAPDMSAAEGFIGWADKSGNVIEAADFDVTMGTSALTFTAVYEDDEFDVVLNLDGGNIGGESSVTVKANYGDTVDLSTYEPEKTGYEFKGFDPETVKIENVKTITSPKATWEAKKYTVKFYLNKADTKAFATVEATYNALLKLSDTPTKEGYSFAQWNDKADDTLASTKAAYNTKWTIAGDKEFYATWTEMDYKFTFMVYDYAAGEWKEFAAKYGNEGQICRDFTNIANSVTADAVKWNGEIQVGSVANNVNSVFTKGATDTKSVAVANGVEFKSDDVFYIQTKVIYSLDVKVPVFEGGKYTENYTTENFKVASGLSTSADPISAMKDFEASKYVAADGYEFIKWNLSNNKISASSTATGTRFTISGASESAFAATAEFDLVRYALRFYINDNNNTVATAEAFGQIGKEISLDGKYTVNGSDYTYLLPEAGVENSEQATPYNGKNGYKSVGFAFYKDSEKSVLEFPFTLTEDMVKTYSGTDSTGTRYINFWHIWEALGYDATFKYKDSTGADKQFVLNDIPVGSNFTTFDPTNNEYPEFGMAFGDYIKANAPTGTRFDRWEAEGGSGSAMEAGGKVYNAVYSNNVYKIYVHLNRGGTLEEDLVKIYTSNFGDDIEIAEDKEAGIEMGKGAIVKNMTFDETQKPTPDCEYIGWNTYHLKDESKGEFDKDNWVAGVNDEGTTIMRGTVIYEPVWKTYREFFFRVYGNGGADDLYSGLGKNFKMYYWKNHRPCQKGDEELNKSPDLNLILGFMPSLENFDFARFFDATMWQSIYLRFDAISLPRSMFTWAGFTGLVSAAWNAIVGLIKGEG